MPFRSTTPRALQADRVELILQSIDALPTLSPLAIRLLEVTSDEDSDADDVIELVQADPALAGKVLRMCGCCDRMSAQQVPTLDRAVKLLGFDAVRSAALSVQVMEMFRDLPSPGGEEHPAEPAFAPVAFWQHSLGVAVMSEDLAASGLITDAPPPGEAFLAGLLHNLGLLALYVILPRSIDRVCRLATSHALSVDEATRRVLGVDTYTAGKRLAEHWELPHALSDVMWLHGQPVKSLPDLPHRPMVALVGLANLGVRATYLSPVGGVGSAEAFETRCREFHLPAERIGALAAAVPDKVKARADSLGVAVHADDRQRLLRALSDANATLERLNVRLRTEASRARRQQETLEAITRFHQSAAPGGSMTTVLGKVARSVIDTYGGRFVAALYQPRLDAPVQYLKFTPEGEPQYSRLFMPPPGSRAIAGLDDKLQVSAEVMTVLPWLADELGDVEQINALRLLPLPCGWGVHAVLVHDCAIDGRRDTKQIEALSRTWGAAIAAATQHQGAKRLGEQLAQANHELIEAQRELARAQSLAVLGEVAAGAAHEMNNPLAVISGRAQQLVDELTADNSRDAAQQIVESAHRLSDMIAVLRAFAEPAHPDRQPIDVTDVVIGAAERAREELQSDLPVDVQVEADLPPAHVDGEQIGEAVGELVRNALQSDGTTQVRVRVQIDDLDGRLKVSVLDDGAGLSEHAKAHAFDPFFSAKKAGRRPGLGLARVRRWIEAHGGTVVIDNRPDGGAMATFWIDPQPPADKRREAA